MCGITGFFSPQKEIDTLKYYSAHRLIGHRGPDDEGFVSVTGGDIIPFKGNDTIDYFQNLTHIDSVRANKLILGHRRLSIIDLTHQGHQPFSDENRNYFLTYNGEIFNYIELRDELKKHGYEFSTSSDTEVVLKAYMQWGVGAFNKFNGMWACAIYDRSNNTLVLSRDRFGIKPLYYALLDGVLYFASEMKFLRAFISEALTPNRESMQAYVDKCLLNHSTATFWSEIKELEPAHYVVFNGAGVEPKRYWDFEPAPVRYSESEALEKFAYLFEDSLQLRMRSDVEVGTLLSGGLDSTLIVCMLDKLGFINNGSFKSFSAVFDEELFSEKRYIDETLKKVDLKPYFVYPKAGNLGDQIDTLLYHIEEPFRSLSIYSQFLIYQMIKRDTNVKVVLNGQGADELFGGYSYHYDFLFADLLRKLEMQRLFHEVKLYKENRGIGGAPLILGILKHFVKSLGYQDYFNAMTFSELRHTALREYLKYDDRTSMAYSIEARVPFLDYRIVEFAFSLDVKYKIENFENKKIERLFARGIIPEDIVNRKDKMGFISPQEEWQRGVFRADLSEVYEIAKKTSAFEVLQDAGYALQQYGDYLEGKNNNWDYVWRLYCLFRWMKIHDVL